MKRFSMIWLLCAVVLLEGCGAMLLAQAGYYDSKYKYEKLYDNYRLENEMINAERARTGLAPLAAIGFKEWLKDQPLSPSEIKVFKLRGLISPREAKEIKEREAKKKKRMLQGCL